MIEIPRTQTAYDITSLAQKAHTAFDPLPWNIPELIWIQATIKINSTQFKRFQAVACCCLNSTSFNFIDYPIFYLDFQSMNAVIRRLIWPVAYSIKQLWKSIRLWQARCFRKLYRCLNDWSLGSVGVEFRWNSDILCFDVRLENKPFTGIKSRKVNSWQWLPRFNLTKNSFKKYTIHCGKFTLERGQKNERNRLVNKLEWL